MARHHIYYLQLRVISIFCLLINLTPIQAELSLNSYSYRYLSSKIDYTTLNPYVINNDNLFLALEDGAYGTHSLIQKLIGQIVVPSENASDNTVAAAYGCGETDKHPNTNIQSNIVYDLRLRGANMVFEYQRRLVLSLCLAEKHFQNPFLSHFRSGPLYQSLDRVSFQRRMHIFSKNRFRQPKRRYWHYSL